MKTTRLKEFTLKYKVTRNDIACGVQGRCSACPQAKAIFRAVQRRFRRWNNPFVSISPSGVSINYRDKKYTIHQLRGRPDRPVRDFIHAFDDDRGAVQPGEFELTFESIT